MKHYLTLFQVRSDRSNNDYNLSDIPSTTVINNSFTYTYINIYTHLTNTIKNLIPPDETRQFNVKNRLNNSNDIVYTIKLIDNLLITLIKQQKKLEHTFTQDKITKFIDRRNDDLKDNQRRMLNSILERQPRQIHLDRIKTIDNNVVKFTMEEDEIERIANNHFQSIGNDSSSPNSITNFESLPDRWKHIYQPNPSFIPIGKTYFDTPITYEEIIAVKKELPLHKAPGPNRISYDIIKKLPDSFFKQL